MKKLAENKQLPKKGLHPERTSTRQKKDNQTMDSPDKRMNPSKEPTGNLRRLPARPGHAKRKVASEEFVDNSNQALAPDVCTEPSS